MLAAAVLLLSSLLRVPSPTVRHLFWMLVLPKPAVMLAYLAPVHAHSLVADGRALVAGTCDPLASPVATGVTFRTGGVGLARPSPRP